MRFPSDTIITNAQLLRKKHTDLLKIPYACMLILLNIKTNI